LAAATACLLGRAAAAEPEEVDFAARARELVALRAQCERLESDLRDERDAQRSRDRGLAAQQEELRLLIRREQVRLRGAEQRAAQRQELLEDQAGRARLLAEPLGAAVEALRELVEGSLPFQRDGRLAELREIEQTLESGALGAEGAASRLWQFVEDELQLTLECALHQDVIGSEGERKLVRVVRLGMVGLFYREAEGSYGRALSEASLARFEKVEGGASIRALDKLFRAFERHVRQGPFELPLELPLELPPEPAPGPSEELTR